MSSLIVTSDKSAVIIKEPETFIVTAGLMGMPGGTHLNEASDVDLTSLQDGSVLVYKTSSQKWTSTKLLNQQNIDAGEF